MEQLAGLGITLESIIFYLVNIGLLIGLLTWLLYKPVMNIIDKRQNEITSEIEQAKELQKEFSAKLAEVRKEREEAEANMNSNSLNLESSRKKRTELIAEMEATRADMMQKAQDEITQRKASILADAESDVKEMMTKIILNIIENQVPEDVIQSSIASGWKQYNK